MLRNFILVFLLLALAAAGIAMLSIEAYRWIEEGHGIHPALAGLVGAFLIAAASATITGLMGLQPRRYKGYYRQDL
jgi:hypothetical protein